MWEILFSSGLEGQILLVSLVVVGRLRMNETVLEVLGEISKGFGIVRDLIESGALLNASFEALFQTWSGHS
jgi:hypothetical protein